MDLPAGLEWMRADPSKRPWLDALPTVVATLADRWALTPGPAYAGSHVSLTLPASRADGTSVVLKVQWPHDDCRHEAEALRRWDGAGAIRLLAHDAQHHALLLERCRPGDSLAGADPEQAVEVLVGLLPRLWVPAGAPFRSLAVEAEGWAAALPGRWRAAGAPFPRRLVDAARAFIVELTTDPPPPVLVHQDLHGDNALAAEREPWLAIDPKPLAGERAFGLAPIIRSPELGHSAAAVGQRLDRLSEGTGVDRERARGWAIAQTVAWAFEGASVHWPHVATATWLLDRA